MIIPTCFTHRCGGPRYPQHPHYFAGNNAFQVLVDQAYPRRTCRQTLLQVKLGIVTTWTKYVRDYICVISFCQPNPPECQLTLDSADHSYKPRGKARPTKRPLYFCVSARIFSLQHQGVLKGKAYCTIASAFFLSSQRCHTQSGS